LIIELDGGFNNSPNQKCQDLERDEALKALGFKIIRIRNNLVLTKLASVLKAIELNFNSNYKP
jgi:very-short-patch-repair endonuclease